nr:hypothetical protein [uncultured Cellulosilyticum sp.]
MVKDITKYLVICFNIIFTFFLSILTYSAIFTNNATCYSFSMSRQIFYVIVGVVVLLLFYLILHKKIEELSNKAIYIIIATTMFILVIFQIRIILQTYTPIGWDVGYIIGGASTTINVDNTEYSGYFTLYPNNLFLTFVFKAIYLCINLFGTFSNIWLMASLVNTVAIDISLLLVFYIVKKMIHNKYALYAYLLCIVTYGTFAWMIVPYSDTMALPLTTGVFALYLFKRSNNKKVINWICNIGMGILLWINYMIKPTAIIIFIAIYLVELAFGVINSKLKNTLKSVGMSLIIMIVIYSGMTIAWNRFIEIQPYFKIEQEKSVPMQHFMMMGLTQSGEFYGMWNEEDINCTLSYATTEERKVANVIKIKEKLKDYGAFGYLDYVMKKARWITSEGTFFWFGEGNFANSREIDNSLFKNLWYPEGKYYDMYQYISQTVWIWILIMCSIPLYFMFKKKSNQYDYWHSIIRCTLMGIILFILLFEGRSRYLILYLPFFCILAIMGVYDLKRYLSDIKNSI